MRTPSRPTRSLKKYPRKSWLSPTKIFRAIRRQIMQPFTRFSKRYHRCAGIWSRVVKNTGGSSWYFLDCYPSEIVTGSGISACNIICLQNNQRDRFEHRHKREWSLYCYRRKWSRQPNQGRHLQKIKNRKKSRYYFFQWNTAERDSIEWDHRDFYGPLANGGRSG
jgi:hypothetical protein